MVGKHTSSRCRFMCWRGKQKERRGEKNSLQSVNQVLRDGYDGFFFPVLFGWLAERIEGATIFLFLPFFFMSAVL